jgi:hypothetical protein
MPKQPYLKRRTAIGSDPQSSLLFTQSPSSQAYFQKDVPVKRNLKKAGSIETSYRQAVVVASREERGPVSLAAELFGAGGGCRTMRAEELSWLSTAIFSARYLLDKLCPELISKV